MIPNRSNISEADIAQLKDDIEFIKNTFIANSDEIENITKRVDNLEIENKNNSNFAIHQEIKQSMDKIMKEIKGLHKKVDKLEHEKVFELNKRIENCEIKTSNESNGIYNQFVNDLEKVNDKLNSELGNIKEQINENGVTWANLAKSIDVFQDDIRIKDEQIKDELVKIKFGVKESIIKKQEIEQELFDELEDMRKDTATSKQVPNSIEIDEIKVNIRELKDLILPLKENMKINQDIISKLESDLEFQSQNYKNYSEKLKSVQPSVALPQHRDEVSSPFKIRISSEEKDEEEIELYNKLEHPSLIKSIDEEFITEESSASPEVNKASNINNPLNDFMESLNQEIKIPSTSKVFSLLYLADFSEGNILLSGHKDGKINAWDLSTMSLFKYYSEHSNIVDDMKEIRHSLFISCSKDHNIKLWNLHSNNSIRTFTTDVWTYCITMLKGDLFATGDDNSNIKIWDIEDETKTGNSKSIIKSGHKFGIGRILFLSKYKPDIYLLTSSFTEIKLWDLTTEKQIQTYNEHTDWINGLIYLKGDLFCSASGDSTIRIWNLHSSISVKIINVHKSNVACLIYLKDILGEDLILTSSFENNQKIVDINTCNVLATYFRDEPVFKMEPIIKVKDGKMDIKIAGCFWNSSNIKIWGKRSIL